MGTTIFYDGPCERIADVELATAGWADWHNYRRLHGRPGMVSPDEHEAAYYAAATPESSASATRLHASASTSISKSSRSWSEELSQSKPKF